MSVLFVDLSKDHTEWLNDSHKKLETIVVRTYEQAKIYVSQNGCPQVVYFGNLKDNKVVEFALFLEETLPCPPEYVICESELAGKINEIMINWKIAFNYEKRRKYAISRGSS